MNEVYVSWDDFKLVISDHIRKNLPPQICRGQADSKWKLVSSFYRNTNGININDYFLLLPELADMMGTIEKRDIKVDNPELTATFVAYLQHHGFPTPILDFSGSPYIAAFFAFSDIQARVSENVSIYIFDFLKWTTHWRQINDYTHEDPHVSVIKPKAMGNSRQFIQQGFYYMFSNVSDIEGHVRACSGDGETYLMKYNIKSEEREYALKDLECMGINFHSLYGTTESFCMHMKNAIFQRKSGGKNSIDFIREHILKMKNDRKQISLP